MTPLKRILIGGLLALLVACGSKPPSGADDLSVTPPQPLSTGTQDQASFLLENTGDTALDWSISVRNDSGNPQSGNWFTVSPDSGRLAAGASQEVTLTLLPGLAEGSYRATLTVSYSGGQTAFDVSGTVGSSSSGFSLATDDVSNSVSPGAEVIVPITINRTGGFSDAVALEVLGAPEGLSGTFSPNPATGDASDLTVQTEASVAAGTYGLTVRGTSGSLSDAAEVEVTVVGTTTEPTFSLALSPSNLSVLPGNSASSSLTVQKTASFASSVSLSASGAPSGVTVGFDPNPTSDSATVDVTVGSGVSPGTYTITISGAGGGVSSSTKLGLTVASASGGTGSIGGRVQTDNDLGDFTVPNESVGTAARAAPGERPAWVPGQLLIGLEPALAQASRASGDAELGQDALGALLGRYGLTPLREAAPDEPLLVAAPAGEDLLALAQRLEQEPGVRYAEPNYYLYPLSIPNDPEFDRQWNLAVAGVPVAWDARDSATSVTVAVLDSGFDTAHEDLAGVFLPGYDFCGNTDCSSRDANVTPDGPADIHGTHVAGIIAASGNNGRGVAGVLKGGARIVPVKVFYDYSYTTADRLAQAIRWASGEGVSGVPANANPAKVINLSLGTGTDSSTLREAVSAARSRGALLIASAGNDGGGVLYPAKYEGVVAVGSVNSNFQRSCFSNTGPEIDVMAAGGDGVVCAAPRDEAVLSTVPDDGYGTLIGTSQAAPVVSGVAALIWSANPGLSADQVASRLKDDAYKVSGMNVVRADYAFGFPRAGDAVTVSASGPSTALDTVTLRIDGSSSSFSLDNLKVGSYTVTANATGERRDLSASQSVSLAAGESKSVTLRLKAD